MVLAPPRGLAPQTHQLESDNLQCQRQQFFRALEVRVLFMQQHEHLLGYIFGGFPRSMRCRERRNPFTKPGENLVALHGFENPCQS